MNAENTVENEEVKNTSVDEAVVAEDNVVDMPEAEVLSETDKLTAERDEWKDKSYRLAAEMENLKKRSDKEILDARKYGVTSFARELLDVQDNLERALTVLEGADVEVEKLAPMIEGVEMVKGQLVKAFDRVNIKRIECEGEKLNPELHQAVMQVPSEEAAGTVVQEIQPGYTISDRLLRPAMVGVATAIVK
ncbi:MAG: molecular chaperone GrpE [Alphaproteobacteria bacterium]|jgi:molecular chaperone GrpE